MTSPQSIADQLQSDILSGALPVGQPLSQTDLAARFGVSRIPIRDALARLAALGLIDQAPNRTAHVIRMDATEVSEAYDLRLLLECDLLARAIPVMTEADLTRIDYALARSNLEAKNANWAEGDQMFHAALYAPAMRPRQAQMITGLRRTCRIQISAYDALPNETERWLADHQALRDACHRRDTNAAVTCLRAHIEGALDTLLQKMSGDA
ncbi:transcriptional regulator, GntR family [Roseovarius marisflavi]|uniref:Transcriptional regulator, GntR family n=1 Tax=Roseovarius marisflavi TaxID=1054996 RepID=A0A1M6YMM0_9RHOB|nr:GntR family transcriptional regulator [Roseovarius marisflavi]SHL19380.1 transcriptional regulator, GntR family [Roseovarius marisflavi]